MAMFQSKGMDNARLFRITAIALAACASLLRAQAAGLRPSGLPDASGASDSKPLAWGDWDRPLDLSGARAMAFSGDDPEWASPSFVPEGWSEIPLMGDFRAVRPDWGPVVWYRLSIVLPPGSPRAPLTLDLGKIADFDRVWFNGQEVGQNAHYEGRLADELYDIPRVYQIPIAALEPGKANLLAIRVDNKGHSVGGLLTGKLGLSMGWVGTGRIDPAELQSLLLNAFYVITGIYFLFLSIRIRSSRANLFFGLFCLDMAVFFLSLLQARALFFHDYGTWIRLRYASLWAAFPLFLCFMISFHHRRFRAHALVYLALSAAAQGVAWLLPGLNRLSWVNTTIMQPSWIYPVAYILYIVIRLSRVNREARTMLGFLIGFVAVISFDVVRSRVMSGPISRMPYLSSYGLLAFILGFAMVLLNRQVRLQGEMEKLFRMATQDALTGTASRAHLENFLSLEITKARRYKRPLSIIMADLDRFKEVNDGHGHQAGDAVLRDFGALLKSSIRECDLAGRYGGEEFIIVLPETPAKGAARLAERIRTAQERHYTLSEGKTIQVSTSIGIADMGPGRERAVDIIRAADEALYEAKRSGRNRSVEAQSALEHA